MGDSLKTILVTGGSGFIGSNFIRYVLDAEADIRIINYDLLTYAGNLRNNEEVASNDRYSFVRGDIASEEQLRGVFDQNTVDVVVNFAAETHVDRSIVDAGPFVRSNVLGTQCLIDTSRKYGVSRYVQISTDEVYGSLGPEGRFREDTPINPTNPYSATKAAADLIVLSHAKTHRFPAVVTRCSNNYGPYQFPEKFIPLMITNAMEDTPIPVYGEGLNRREWIYVDDHSRGVWGAITRGRDGEVYNIGGGEEIANIDLVRQVLAAMGRSESLIEFVTDRPGHDLRYAMDFKREQRDLDWSPEMDFEPGLCDTVGWYLRNTEWWRPIKNGTYRDYYAEQYGTQLRDQQ